VGLKTLIIHHVNFLNIFKILTTVCAGMNALLFGLSHVFLNLGFQYVLNMIYLQWHSNNNLLCLPILFLQNFMLFQFTEQILDFH
jgi:hypothetical protein